MNRLPTHDQHDRLCELLSELETLADELPDWVTETGSLGHLFLVLGSAVKEAYELPSGGAL
jgi:hypothetical protein